MSTPGAVTLGTIVSTARLGPRDEKLAMMSPYWASMTNVVPAIVADVVGAGGQPRPQRRAVGVR